MNTTEKVETIRPFSDGRSNMATFSQQHFFNEAACVSQCSRVFNVKDPKSCNPDFQRQLKQVDWAA